MNTTATKNTNKAIFQIITALRDVAETHLNGLTRRSFEKQIDSAYGLLCDSASEIKRMENESPTRDDHSCCTPYSPQGGERVHQSECPTHGTPPEERGGVIEAFENALEGRTSPYRNDRLRIATNRVASLARRITGKGEKSRTIPKVAYDSLMMDERIVNTLMCELRLNERGHVAIHVGAMRGTLRAIALLLGSGTDNSAIQEAVAALGRDRDRLRDDRNAMKDEVRSSKAALSLIFETVVSQAGERRCNTCGQSVTLRDVRGPESSTCFRCETKPEVK